MMTDGYKLIESNVYALGEANHKWNLYVALYQQGQSYCYVIIDKEDAPNAIVSAIVSPASANYLEGLILESIVRPYSLETISDVMSRLPSTLFGWQGVTQ